MKPLAERHADRIIRKGEHALAEGLKFDTSKSGIGQVHPDHADADAIEEADAAAITHAASVIGAAPARAEPGFAPTFQHKVKLSGI